MRVDHTRGGEERERESESKSERERAKGVINLRCLRNIRDRGQEMDGGMGRRESIKLVQ